jgi:hypothetical protein
MAVIGVIRLIPECAGFVPVTCIAAVGMSTFVAAGVKPAG